MFPMDAALSPVLHHHHRAARPPYRTPARPAQKPVPARIVPLAARPAHLVAARPAAVRMATRTKSGQRPARFNDNPDFGLPSGRDYPDAGLRPVAPAALPFVPPVQQPYVLPVPAAPVAPAAPAVPTFACDYYCQFDGYNPVCTASGNEYDNDCYRQCRQEAPDCDHSCPCNTAPPTPAQPLWADPCANCAAEGNDPVCVDDETNYQNECYALCEGKTITCSSTCPC
uniref:Serine protease inhibitor 1 n=1 Tax=Mesodesma donacium TaxID=282296 RepID=M1KCQ5_9BIVA|nr:serine protease inhibitor 1 [Mesodesma donacium]